MKIAYRFILLLIVSSLGSLAALNENKNDQRKSEQKKEHKFFNDAIEEKITIYSRESINSEKKIARKGILLKRPKAKATVLICHGFMCDKYDVSFLHMMFKEYNSMIFDFRAHGEDREGQCCTFGRDESYDVIAAAQFIKNHPELKDLPVIMYGFSMGAVAGIMAQAREKNLFDGLILDCPFDSSDKLLDRMIDNLKITMFGYELPLPGSTIIRNYAYSQSVQSMLMSFLKTFTKLNSIDINICINPVYPEEAIKYVTAPCFFIGCVNDDKAPEEAVLAVYEGAQGYKRCWIDPEGRRHYDTIFRQLHRYFYKVDRFIKTVVDGSYKEKTKAKIKKDRPYCVLTAAKESKDMVH